jgi:hypothetical protein
MYEYRAATFEADSQTLPNHHYGTELPDGSERSNENEILNFEEDKNSREEHIHVPFGELPGDSGATEMGVPGQTKWI